MTDNKYKNGKIYTIRYKNDDSLIYVGSTVQPLFKRWHSHKSRVNNEKFNNILLYKKIRETNIEDWYIELYEDFSCERREQLDKREGEVIRQIGTLNKCIAGRTKKEWDKDNIDKIKEYQKEYREANKEYQKEYYEVNKDKKKEYYEANKDKKKEYYEANKDKKKEYYEANKDKIKERDKKYYEDNKERIFEQQKEYFEANKERINEQRRQRYKNKKTTI